MTTVAQMIKWLNTLPKDASVECGVEVSRGYDTWMEMKPVNIECCDIIAFTSKEDRIKYPNMAGKTIVMIQGE